MYCLKLIKFKHIIHSIMLYFGTRTVDNTDAQNRHIALVIFKLTRPFYSEFRCHGFNVYSNINSYLLFSITMINP